jgi:SpoVK/Ycf46/Vps4 family AAA+-type ATPase
MSGLNTNKGFTLLLHGEPGTGKTATVKQLARKTGRHILMVDTSKIKDMFVGESEKNIRRVFKEYAQAKNFFERHPILLFNEADALIGKRISVNSSVDQMNNTMQNILLQQLEDFEGIFIATTNLPNSLDDAFNRRLLYKVAYSKPDKTIRLQLLQQHFKDMTIPFLEMINERYPLTGAQIMNINKKLLVERFLHEEVDLPQLIEQFCREELQLLKSTKEATIGFLKRVSYK